jgi:thiosulfate/3-mercaptopyruvate sulfurtransferase
MSCHPIYPDSLITTEEVSGVQNDTDYRFIEVNLDPEAHGQGHLDGAIGWNWATQLRNHETNEIVSIEEFAELAGKSGIGPDTHVVIYGDNNNWFATWAFWLFHMIGHKEVRLMDGGSRKWVAEGRELTAAPSTVPPRVYPMEAFDLSSRASTEDVFAAFFNPETHRLVDVRSSSEFEGKRLAPAGLVARCVTGGHIPTAINIPWNLNCNPDGTFKNPVQLRDLYASFDISPENVVITYCAIGERASLSWFVLKRLLNHDVVMNYDRSMAQWSRLANAPIIKAAA